MNVLGQQVPVIAAAVLIVVFVLGMIALIRCRREDVPVVLRVVLGLGLRQSSACRSPACDNADKSDQV